ncbi:hypothetical protein CW304_20780 [Bacillus sp. UFRGS-B20]|nr:hypothetical protein CW304_20780 [Bacillus sp. UFRGS-B20]
MPFRPFSFQEKLFANLYGAKTLYSLRILSILFISGESFIALFIFSMFGFYQILLSVAISLFTNGYFACIPYFFHFVSSLYPL